MPACAVVCCKQNYRNKIYGITFHRFPKNRRLAAKWLKVVGLPRKTLIQNLRICSQHFNENDIKLFAERKFITDTAIPSLNLPHYKLLSTLPNKENVVLLSVYSDGVRTQEIFKSNDELPASISEPVPQCTIEKQTLMCPLENSISHDKINVSSPLMKVGPESTFSSKIEIEVFSVEPDTEHSNSSEASANINLIKAFHSYSHAPDYQSKMIAKLRANNNALKKSLHAERKTSERRKKTIIALKDTVSQLKRQASVSADPFKILSSTLEGVPLELSKRMVQNSSGSLTKEAYSPELKSFAMALQSYNGKAYDYVRRVFDFALPCPSTVRAWLSLKSSDNSKELTNKPDDCFRHLLCNLD